MPSRHPDPVRTRRFVALDGLRGVGALAVLTTHVGFNSGVALNERFGAPIGRLDVGVALFFVVSGFLLFRPHVASHLDLDPPPRLGSYVVRRAARILPVLWLAVCATWLFIRTTEGINLYVAHATLTQIYVEDHHLQGLTQMWSLATEVAFYIILPPLAWLLCRGSHGRAWLHRVVPILLLFMVIGPLWMFFTTTAELALAPLWLPGFMGWFAAGMLLAVWFEARERGIIGYGLLDELAQHPGTVWSIAAALLMLASTRIAGPLDLSPPTPLEALTKNALYLVIGTLTVLPCVRGPRAAAGTRFLSGPVGKFVGDISYGIFAYHVIVLVLIERWLGLTAFDGRFIDRLVLTAALSLVVAAMSFYFMERPLMARVRSARQRSRSASRYSPTHREPARSSRH